MNINITALNIKKVVALQYDGTADSAVIYHELVKQGFTVKCLYITLNAKKDQKLIKRMRQNLHDKKGDILSVYEVNDEIIEDFGLEIKSALHNGVKYAKILLEFCKFVDTDQFVINSNFVDNSISIARQFSLKKDLGYIGIRSKKFYYEDDQKYLRVAPLLKLNIDEIMKYAQDNNLKYIPYGFTYKYDEQAEILEYMQNNTSVIEKMIEVARYKNLKNREVRESLNIHSTNIEELVVSELIKTNEDAKYYLIYYLIRYGARPENVDFINKNYISDIIKKLHPNYSFTIPLGTNQIVVMAYNRLYIDRVRNYREVIAEVRPSQNIRFYDYQMQNNLDIKIYVRNFRNNDIMKFAGHQVTIDQFFNENKVPNYLRLGIPIVTTLKNEIIAIPGIYNSELIKWSKVS